MPFTYDSRQAELALATGASASSPDYALPIERGIPVASQALRATEPASPLVVAQSAYKTDLEWRASLTLPILPLSMGTLLKGMLWAESANSGTHTFTAGSSEAWLTLWSLRPGGLYEKWTNGAVETLEIAARPGEFLTAEVGLIGLGASVLGSTYSAGATESTSYFLPSGRTLKVAWSGTSTATQAGIVDASVRFQRPALAHPALNASAGQRIDRGSLTGEISIDLIYENADAYRASFFGSASGTSLSGTVTEGAIEFTYVAGTNSLKIEMPRVAWEAEPNPADGGGGAIRVNVKGTMLRPTSGADPVTVTLVNARSGAY